MVKYLLNTGREKSDMSMIDKILRTLYKIVIKYIDINISNSKAIVINYLLQFVILKMVLTNYVCN